MPAKQTTGEQQPRLRCSFRLLLPHLVRMSPVLLPEPTVETAAGGSERESCASRGMSFWCRIASKTLKEC